ncbi:ABC transporter permease [Oleiagrimonas sp. MCCC 1A03011]|uniref:ABC transporter permease n=1 Tax=Oleiagrimonas sp. MCCC 1A03011 TaxID=1926883 RepID=UPI000DC49A18|nr:ABC transporter permease [Oleiagrimonas sp. MCCC 1A03011]RAP58514.1 ABC transporter ATP-binding protein [Oleiagrimonas sp. MCCC 1A03011]
MFFYYLQLAIRSFRRNRALTLLMVLTLGLGIGASITTLTVLKLLSGDPLPTRSVHLFTPVINPWPAGSTGTVEQMPRWWGDMMSYTDAMSLMHARKAKRQAVTTLTKARIAPTKPGAFPFFGGGVLTTPDFFAMFDVPFAYGGGWSAQDGENRARVVVISSALNNRLFAGRDSVGKMLRVNDHEYRIIGVLKPWAPQPRFYALNFGDTYGDGDAVYLPLQSARANHMLPTNYSCWGPANTAHMETSPCAWVNLWVEFEHAADARAYKQFLKHYVQQQMALGRLHQPRVWLYSLTGFLDREQVVPSDLRLQTNLAFGFLLICIVNTVGLLLAKCLWRSREIGVRRAMGAMRRMIFAQYMVESAIVGITGGVLGLVFAELGLLAIRHQPASYAHLAHLDPSMFAATFAVALVASLIAGLLPAWRACVVVPAPQLKSI